MFHRFGLLSWDTFSFCSFYLHFPTTEWCSLKRALRDLFHTHVTDLSCLIVDSCSTVNKEAVQSIDVLWTE